MTPLGRGIAEATGRFMLFYAGVFALLALTAAVGAGLLATTRVVITPGGRIMAQAVHRAVSLAAIGLLGMHIALEVLAGRAAPADSVIPFLAHRRSLYLGFGTLASDLLLLIAVTGVLRGRFAAGRRQWGWRVLHAAAYLAWPLAILHGLLSGRTARPYVDWSYGACVAAVAIALLLRLLAPPRPRETPAGPAVPAAWPPPSPGLWPAAPLFGVPPGGGGQRALVLPPGDPAGPADPPGGLPR
jgi:hypothetical protein